MAGVEVKGLRETIRSLERLGVAASDLKGAMTKIGAIVADAGHDLAPTLTGALAASIRPGRAKNRAVVRAGGASIPYAGVIHYGWPGHNIEPNPFLTDALAAKQAEALTTLDAELRDLIRRYGLN